MTIIRKKSVKVLLLICAFIVTSIGSAYAAVNSEPIKAYLNKSVSFVVNGDLWVPKTSDGRTLSAINYEGTNYLPVRAIAEALKIPVDYDAANQKIYIGHTPGAQTPLFSTPIKIDEGFVVQTKDKAETFIHGKQFSQVLMIDNVGDIYITLDRKYKRFVMDAAVLGTEYDVEFTLYNGSDLVADEDMVVLERYTVGYEEGVKRLVYDVEGLEKIKLNVKSRNTNIDVKARILDTSFFDNEAP